MFVSAMDWHGLNSLAAAVRRVAMELRELMNLGRGLWQLVATQATEVLFVRLRRGSAWQRLGQGIFLEWPFSMGRCASAETGNLNPAIFYRKIVAYSSHKLKAS